MMLDSFWDQTIKLLFLKNAMESISAFRPLGKTPAQVQTMLEEREAARSDYVDKHTLLQDGQAAVRAKLAEARRESIRTYALMKSAYQDNRRKLDLIVRIPKKDPTV